MPPSAGANPLFVIGMGAIRIEIVVDPYGFLEFRIKRHRSSIIEVETTTDDRFDPSLINELICRREQTRMFFEQRAVAASAAPIGNHQ